MDGSAQSRVGTRFAGRYDLAEVLGEGGMGAVYRARHAFTGANVALKIMHSGVARSKNARERFLREAQAPTSIGHPGIVKVSDAGADDDGTLYLVLELLDGEDLGAAVERGAVDGAMVIDVAIELLDTLSAAHASGLVHRDIKPENIFLCRPGGGGPRVRLLDFGITRQVSETDEKLTQTGTILGTPHYMSPEQARGQAVDARSDIYSVGGTLFFALTGRPPFTAENYNLLIVAIMTHPAPSIRSVRPDVPRDLAAVVDRALASDVSQRFASAAEMRAALDACDRPSLEPVRPAPAAVGFAPTMPSDAEISIAQTSTPVVHSMPEQVSPGAATKPDPAKTPRSGPPPAGQRQIPPTMGASAVAVPQTAPAKKGSRTGLLVGLVIVLGALIGGGVAAYVLIPTGPADPPVEPPAAVTTQGALPPVTPMEPSMEGATEGSMEGETAEGMDRLSALEEELAQLREREAAREEEEAARMAAQRRAAMRRAEERAAMEAERRAAVTRCQLRCSQDLASCQRESGGMGLAASECHRGWVRCREDCER